MDWSQLYHSNVNPDWLRQEKSWMTSISCFHMYRPYSTGIVRRKKKMWWSMPITMSVIDRWWPCEKPQQRLIHVAKLRLTLLAERAKELTLAKSHLILSTRDLWKAALRGYNTWPGSGCLSSSEYALPNFRERGISIRMEISNQDRMSNEIVVLGSGQESLS